MKRSIRKQAVIGLIVGCLIIGSVSAFALAGGNAYQDFKAATLKTALAQNMTINAEVTVRQDGASVLSGDAVMQIAGDATYSSSVLNIGGATIEFESSEKDGNEIDRIGDRYTSKTRKERDRHDDDFDFENSPAIIKLAEMVTDLMIGDVKTHFYGSSNTISVNLEGAQIPELLNVAVSAAVESMASKPGKGFSEKDILRNIIENLTVANDVSIKRIAMETQLSDGYIEDIAFVVVLTGKDKSGTSHEVEIVCNAAITDIGSTVPDTVNTQGKEVAEKTRR